MSCHGPNGLFGLRTPHPDRQSCFQCHVPEAGLDQRNFSGLAAGELPLEK
jgi:cytochrome c-type protein NapB